MTEMINGKPWYETEEGVRKHLKIAPNASVTVLALGEGEIPVKTAGWSDDQINAKSMVEIETMIRSGELAVENLRQTIAAEEERISGLRLVKQRKIALGG